MNRSETIGKVMDALRQAQTEFDPVLKDARNPLYNSKYAQLSGVIDATQSALAKNGLVVSQLAISNLEHRGAGIATVLAHTSGEFISSDFLLPAEGRGKNETIRYDAQTACAAVTYARRYAYLAILGVAAEDDDGNQASGHRPSAPSQDDMPDFHDARHAAPRPPAAPQAKAEAPKTTHKPEPPTVAPKEQLPPPPPPVPAEKQNQGPAVAPEHGDAYEGPDNPPAEPATGTLPTEDQMTEYRRHFKYLSDELSANGKLTASKGLKTNTKLRVFLQQVEKVNSPNELTVEQWTDFFDRADKIIASPAGIVGLTKLINKANGIESK